MDEKYVGREKMENKFCLLNCRFHKKNKRKLLIQGYFEQNELQGCRPVITLDYHVLEYEILSRTVLNNPLEYLEYGRPTKRYFFVVNLPEDYQKYKELRCFQYEGAEIEELFYLSTKWLVKKEQEEEFHIDESIWVDKGFRICGWCTCTGDAKLYLSNKEDGKTSLPVHVKKMRVAYIMTTDKPKVVEEAVTPKSPSSPSVAKNTALGGLLGMVIAMGIITIVYLMNDTIQTEEDVRKYLDLHTLAVVPMEKRH